MFHEIITKSVLNFFVLFWDYWLKEFQANMCLPQIIAYVQSARTKKTPQKMKELDYKVSLFPSSPSLSLPPCFHVYKTSHPCLCVYRGSNIISFSKLIYSSLVYSAFLRSLIGRAKWQARIVIRHYIDCKIQRNKEKILHSAVDSDC